MSGSSSSSVRRLPPNLQEIFFIPLCIFFYVIATNTESGWLYVLLAVMLGLLVTGWIGPRLTVRGLAVRREVVGDPRVGDSVLVRLEVTNKNRRARHYLMVRDVLPGELQSEGVPIDRRLGIDRLPPGHSQTVEYLLPCRRRGVFHLTGVSVVSATPLGLYPASRDYRADGQVIVLPTGPHVPRLPIHTAVPATVIPQHVSSAVGRSHDFAGLREYQPGEDIRFIHWPSTARTGELMIREFLDASSQSVVVLLDGHRSADVGPGSRNLFEQMVSTATAVCEAAHRNNMALTLVLGQGGEVQVLRHPRGPQMLYALAQVKAVGAMSLEHFLRTSLPSVPPRAHLFLVTGRSGLVAEALAPFVSRRVHVSVLLVRPFWQSRRWPPDLHPDAYRAAAEGLRRSGVQVYEIDEVERLPDVLAGGLRG